jgi:hypothetical protein
VYRWPRDRGAVEAGLSRRDAEDLCVAKIEELRGAGTPALEAYPLDAEQTPSRPLITATIITDNTRVTTGEDITVLTAAKP